METTAREFFRWADRTVAAANAGVALPCRRGCSYCCQGNNPAVTPADQAVLLEGLQRLNSAKRQRLLHGAIRLRAESSDSSTADRDLREPCPLLENGECLVYHHRPLACRLYGSAQSSKGRIFGCDAVRLRVAFTGDDLVQLNAVTRPFDRRPDAAPQTSLIDWLSSLDGGATSGLKQARRRSGTV